MHGTKSAFRLEQWHRLEGNKTKLSIVRGGGLAGMVTKTELSSDKLSDDDAVLLRERSDEAGLLAPAPARAGGGDHPTADEFSYEVTVVRDGNSQTVQVNEGTMSDALKSLLSWVEQHPQTAQTIEGSKPR